MTAKPRKKPKANEHRPGCWQAKGIDPETGGRKSYYGATAEEASDKAYASFFPVEQFPEPDPDPLDDTLFNFYAYTYLPTVELRSGNWKSQIGWAMDNHVLPWQPERKQNPDLTLADVPIAQIDRKMLQRMFNELRTVSGLAPSSLNKVRIVIGGVFNLAEADDVLTKNPCRLIRLPTARKPDKRSLTFAQCRELLDKSHDSVRPVIILGLCGLRRGEALGVTFAALAGDVIDVRQQVLQPKGGCEISSTLKTPESYRKVPLPSSVRTQLAACNQVSGIYVCSDEKGGYLTPKNAARELGRVLEKTSMGKGYISLHELRHTFISQLENELEVPPAVVAALAGKSDKRNNGEYSHAFLSQMRKAMERYWTEIHRVREVAHLKEA